MFGFWKKRRPEEETRTARDEQTPGSATAKKKRPPLKVSMEGGFLRPPQLPQEAIDQSPPEPVPGPLPRKNLKAKLKLMTDHEERERSYRAAREHFINQQVPDLSRVRIGRKRGERLDYIWERFVAYTGILLVGAGWYWCYANWDRIDTWWRGFLKSIDLF